MDWNDPLRPAIHEIGHVVVEYVLRGSARDCYCYKEEDGSYGGQTAALASAQPTGELSLQENINLAAEFAGGWAAVNLAISGGLLPAAPANVETTPGDFGYFGSDNEWVTKLAAVAEPNNPSSAEGRAKTLALNILEPHINAVHDLATFCVGAGYVSGQMVEEAIVR